MVASAGAHVDFGRKREKAWSVTDISTRCKPQLCQTPPECLNCEDSPVVYDAGASSRQRRPGKLPRLQEACSASLNPESRNRHFGQTIR